MCELVNCEGFLYFQYSRKQLDPDSEHFMTSLVVIGHMTELFPKEFGEAVKTSVSTFVVKDLLMKDKVRTNSHNS